MDRQSILEILYESVYDTFADSVKMKGIFFLSCFCLSPYQIIIIIQLMISFGNLRPFKEKEFLLRFCFSVLSRFSVTSEMARLSG